MRDNALSVANYILTLSQEEGRDLKPLALVKLVYIAYGYALAIIGRSILDERFDEVQAWKLGPVIPSVYHTFKHNRNNPIHDKAVTYCDNGTDTPDIHEPMLDDTEAADIIRLVWDKYKNMTDSQLVTLLHQNDTPWKRCYIEGQNVVIPEAETRAYYRNVVDTPLKRHRRYRLKNTTSDEELINRSSLSDEPYHFPSGDTAESIDDLVRSTTGRVIKPVEKWLQK